MFAVRGIVVGALIGAATLVGGGAAMADTIWLEPAAPVVEPVQGSGCDYGQQIFLPACILNSIS
ncbi:hypothetical protein AB0M22_11260 [Nocardia sp. NPDC051756]|uniref:hypothetical protein n=1 Tax=Nocardia sp. NPDC051756 TaxID=3154751 RepID=UPI0034465A86